jgi:hypothetical protein
VKLVLKTADSLGLLMAVKMVHSKVGLMDATKAGQKDQRLVSSSVDNLAAS